MKVVVMWTGLSGYLNACLRCLVDTPGVELLVIHLRPDGRTPFDESQFGWLPRSFLLTNRPTKEDKAAASAAVEEFCPDAMLVCGWNNPTYRSIARGYRGKAARLLYFDNNWLGNVRQRLGVLASPLIVLPCFDGAFVPGEPQARFARRLGIPEHRIWRGALSCDAAKFAKVRPDMGRPVDPARRAFLYVGRLAREKGISCLAEAYRRYNRKEGSSAWRLIVCGAGPLSSEMQGLDGVDVEGFVQPSQLPAAYGRAACILVPSLFEPWAVTINEATSAGVVVVCTSVCGAAQHLVRQGYNGYTIAPGDVDALVGAMSRVSAKSDEELGLMMARSAYLGAQYTPELWVEHLLEGFRSIADVGAST